MRVSDRLRNRFHRTARFWPILRSDPSALPALQLAGVLVFVYLDDDRTELCVSVDLDTVHPAVTYRTSSGPRVPLRITVQGQTVYRK